jgi:hypothetical protein
MKATDSLPLTLGFRKVGYYGLVHHFVFKDIFINASQEGNEYISIYLGNCTLLCMFNVGDTNLYFSEAQPLKEIHSERNAICRR